MKTSEKANMHNEHCVHVRAFSTLPGYSQLLSIKLILISGRVLI